MLNKEDWQRHILEQQRSGLSKQGYCSRNGLAKNRFYYWEKKLTAKTEPKDIPGFVRLSGNGFEIQLPSGIKIKVSSASELREAIEVLDV